jgi:pyridoxamine 5'-phosphate oxidase
MRRAGAGHQVAKLLENVMSRTESSPVKVVLSRIHPIGGQRNNARDGTTTKLHGTTDAGRALPMSGAWIRLSVTLKIERTERTKGTEMRTGTGRIFLYFREFPIVFSKEWGRGGTHSYLLGTGGFTLFRRISRQEFAGWWLALGIAFNFPHLGLDFSLARMPMADIRRDYSHGSLDRQNLEAEPLGQFNKWFKEASGERSGSRLRKIGIALFKLWHAVLGHKPPDVNAMVLATVDENGAPSARNVLLKGVDRRGFIFYTNYDSRKGRELSQNSKAALVFYWPELERQVCVRGAVSKVSREESEAYFRSRPRGSRISAWASNQSDIVGDRQELDEKWRKTAEKFASGDVPLPPNWGGYVLSPESIEFWQGRSSRLHDRFCYRKQPDGIWLVERLSP